MSKVWLGMKQCFRWDKLMILRQIKANFNLLLNGIVKIKVFIVQRMVYIGKTDHIKKFKKISKFHFGPGNPKKRFFRFSKNKTKKSGKSKIAIFPEIAISRSAASARRARKITSVEPSAQRVTAVPNGDSWETVFWLLGGCNSQSKTEEPCQSLSKSQTVDFDN